MNHREEMLINELRQEISKHKEQIQHYKDHIKRNTYAKESHESKCAEAEELLYKLEGFK